MYRIVSPKVASLNLLVPYIFSNRTQSAGRSLHFHGGVVEELDPAENFISLRVASAI